MYRFEEKIYIIIAYEITKYTYTCMYILSKIITLRNIYFINNYKESRRKLQSTDIILIDYSRSSNINI